MAGWLSVLDNAFRPAKSQDDGLSSPPVLGPFHCCSFGGTGWSDCSVSSTDLALVEGSNVSRDSRQAIVTAAPS
jgi:hypothetical protein